MPRRPPIEDERWMRIALAQARRGEGLTRPNPPVGAVLVRNGRLLGRGFHRRAGRPHAEINALRAAGDAARGATLYVTLEPCSTWGRTPPCTEQIIARGIRRVVIGCPDPNPNHAGRGVRILRRAGLSVTVGVCGPECAGLVAPFHSWITRGLPYVTLKLGASLDGRIADARGRSRWITGPEARREAHRLRRRVDAILVGRQTVAVDNPSLLPVPSGGRKPLRVVLDAAGRIPLRARVFSDGHPEQTLVLISARCAPAYRRALARRGIETAVLPAPRGRFAPGRILRLLGARGLLHVLCEGGGHVAASFLRARRADEIWWFAAPLLLGANGKPAVAGTDWALDRAPRLAIADVRKLGRDIWIRARPEE